MTEQAPIAGGDRPPDSTVFVVQKDGDPGVVHGPSALQRPVRAGVIDHPDPVHEIGNAPERALDEQRLVICRDDDGDAEAREHGRFCYSTVTVFARLRG